MEVQGKIGISSSLGLCKWQTIYGLTYSSPSSTPTSSGSPFSRPVVAFNDRSTNSGLAAGELFPVVHMGSRVLTGNTHASYCPPAFTVTFGNVATYSIIPTPAAVSESRNLTFDASPLFTVTIATTSPFDLSTPNIVMITLKMSSPFPVSACASRVVINDVVRIAPTSNKIAHLLSIYMKIHIHRQVGTSMAK